MNRLMISRDSPAGDRAGEASVEERARPDRVRSVREQLLRMDRAWPAAGRGSAGASPVRLSLEERIGGREEQTPDGPVYVVDSSYRGGYRHGHHRLDAFHAIDREGMSAFCGEAERAGSPDEGEVLFLDLETTGLSLGAGTYVFLVGMGFFREGTYRIRQFFLRSFEEEARMMASLGRWIEPFGTLVTFNGKRFDLPLLEARFSMCAEPAFPADGKAHWDLLYPVRRLWRDRQDDCRLGTMEKTRLGVVREGRDIPGSEIPSIYYRYVHEGDTRDLDRVLYHNAMDVLTLTTLAVEIDRGVRDLDPGSVNVVSVGRFFEQRGWWDRGRVCYELVAGGEGLARSERDEGLYRLALRMKREGRKRETIPLWKELVDRGGERLVECCEELAKVYEHETREWAKASKAVERALEHVSSCDPGRKGRLEHRLRRLERKQGKAPTV